MHELDQQIFQSTLLIRGATVGSYGAINDELEFQSTLLIRGATSGAGDVLDYVTISIHAPHTRSDPAVRLKIPFPADFNPRSSYEERPIVGMPVPVALPFQSTLLIRGATLHCLAITMR